MIRLALLIPIIFFNLFCFAQSEEQNNEAKQKIGLAASVQSDQFGILIPIWTDEKTAVVPSVQVAYAQEIGLDLGIGISLRSYLREGDVRPYLIPSFGVLMSFPESDDDDIEAPSNPIDLVLGFGAGGEYFFSDYFSAGVQIGLNGAFSDEDSNRFGNPGNFSLNTAASVLVNVYF